MGLEVVKTGAEVPLEDIRTSRQKVRRQTADQGIENLLQSIQKHGQIHAVSLLADEHGAYELINGHRRFTAAQKGGLPTLRANIYRVPPESRDRREMLIQQHLYAANMAEPLIDLERGYMFKAVKDDFGLDDAGVAACFEGETEESVRKALRFLEIDKRALEVVQAYPDRFDEGTLNVLSEYASREKRGWRLNSEEQVRIAETIAKQENKLAAVDARELEKKIRGVVKSRRAEAQANHQKQQAPKAAAPTTPSGKAEGAAIKALFRRIEQLELAVDELQAKGAQGVTDIQSADKAEVARRLYDAVSKVDSFVAKTIAPLATSKKELP